MMTTLFVDTNFWLRFLLRDHLPQLRRVRRYIDQARAGHIELVLIPEIVMEVVYVLEKTYHVPRGKISVLVGGLVQSAFVTVQHRDDLTRALKRYPKHQIDFVDFLLHERAREEGAEVLSFDRDFKLLERKR